MDSFSVSSCSKVLLAEIKKLEGQKMVTAFDTWKCHICGEERPNGKISVLTKPLIINGQVCGEQNIRYCNDRPACIERAKEFSFFEGRE